jgi:hypothetical protein
VVKAPARDPSDLKIANSAEAALFHPEKAKRLGTPKRVQHMRTFSIFEIGFVGRIVRVGFALHFNVSFNGCALCAVQPHLAKLSRVIVAFPEETPVVSPIALIVFLSEPGRGLLRMPSPCPPPQTVEDRMINV